MRVRLLGWDGGGQLSTCPRDGFGALKDDQSPPFHQLGYSVESRYQPAVAVGGSQYLGVTLASSR